MKKDLLLLLFIAVLSLHSNSQNLNVTLAGTLSYGNTGLANICGWKSPVDGKEYALVGAANGMSIVNVTNPASPVQIKLIPGSNSVWREIKTNGNYAYVTTEAGGGLQIVDLTNLPGTSLPVATWAPTISGKTLGSIHALHIDNGKVYLYGSNIGNKGAVVADIATSPMSPVYLGSYDNRYIHDGYVRGDTLYACHIYQGDCEIVNMKNPAAGVSLADFQTPSVFTHNSWLTKDSKICFTTDEVSNSFLASYDITNLNNITELDRIQSNPGSQSVVHNTHIIQKNGVDYAVTSWYKDGFTIVDASHPSNLVQVGNYDTAPTASGAGESNCWGVYPFLPSGTIVASDMQNGLFVCSPTYVRACFLEGVVMDCNTGNPLAGAKVQLLNPPVQNINSATDLTDAYGKYGVGVVTASTYTVIVSKQAYVSQTFTVSVTSGNTTTLNVNLCPQTPPFSYTGHVFDNATSVGIKGANVHMQDSSLVWDTLTDANGNFTIPSMLSGTYDIIVGKWGYITKCFSNQNINSLSSGINVGLDAGIYDDFSFDWGWIPSGICSNAWVRGVPIGTIDGANGNAIANPDKDDQTDCSGQAFVTDNGGGASSDHDVDPPGYAILTSPLFDPTSFSAPMVSYSRWFYDAKLNNKSPNDTMEIYISNGSTTVLLERILNNTAGNGTWAHKSYKISSFAPVTATMQISISISDANPGSVVEGGFDKFYVYDSATVAVNNISAAEKNVLVYPNPFVTSTSVQITNHKLQAPILTLYDVFGREVRRLKLETLETKIDRGNLVSGIYFYKVTDGEALVDTGKIVIE